MGDNRNVGSGFKLLLCVSVCEGVQDMLSHRSVPSPAK